MKIDAIVDGTPDLVVDPVDPDLQVYDRLRHIGRSLRVIRAHVPGHVDLTCNTTKILMFEVPAIITLTYVRVIHSPVNPLPSLRGVSHTKKAPMRGAAIASRSIRDRSGGGLRTKDGDLARSGGDPGFDTDSVPLVPSSTAEQGTTVRIDLHAVSNIHGPASYIGKPVSPAPYRIIMAAGFEVFEVRCLGVKSCRQENT